MFDQLNEARQKADEMKHKLDLIQVEGESGNRKVVVVMNANRKIKDVTISDEMMNAERKEELQDLIQVAMEKAMKSAEDVAQSEMNALMQNMMPGGLGNIFQK